MLAIAIETSGRAGSVAVVCEDGRIEQRPFARGLRHAVEMIPTLDEMLRERGAAPRDVGEVYVSAGPGSFTGLRVAITFAKTMALSAGSRIVAVPTVDALALNAEDLPEVGALAVVLDAKRGQVYCAGFRRGANGTLAKVLDASLLTPDELLARMGRPLWLAGEGIAYHADPLTAEGVRALDESRWPAQARNVARVGMALAAQGRYADPDTLCPIYIRRPEAEELWEKRHGGGSSQ
jgi:tRNA threonylcarbamoyladenosine biosynthesis protein TsaB